MKDFNMAQFLCEPFKWGNELAEILLRIASRILISLMEMHVICCTRPIHKELE